MMQAGGAYGIAQRMQMAMAMAQMQQALQTMMANLLFGGFPMPRLPAGRLPMPQFPIGGAPGAGAYLKPELPKLAKGKWIAPHGGYKKLGDGKYKITKGEYKDHTLVHQGKGLFHVYDNCNCIKGQWQSPAKKEKVASPLTFDLNGDGKVSTTNGGKAFDINADGKIDNSGWAGKGDGVLAFDADGDGKVGEDGSELFGNNTVVDGKKFNNGFEALRALANKASREIPGFGPVGQSLTANQLKMMGDKYKLKMMVDGQQRNLSDLGITSINLGYAEGKNVGFTDANGNQHRQIGAGFTMNGETRQVNDVWFKYT